MCSVAERPAACNRSVSWVSGSTGMQVAKPVLIEAPKQGSPWDTEDVDENLVGGIANAGEVVRSGEFVLRPTNPYSATIHGFLKALRGTGFQGASLPVEIGNDFRERLIYIEGDVPVPPFPACPVGQGPRFDHETHQILPCSIEEGRDPSRILE